MSPKRRSVIKYIVFVLCLLVCAYISQLTNMLMANEKKFFEEIFRDKAVSVLSTTTDIQTQKSLSTTTDIPTPELSLSITTDITTPELSLSITTHLTTPKLSLSTITDITAPELSLFKSPPSLHALCSERLFVFCVSFGYQFDQKEIAESILQHNRTRDLQPINGSDPGMSNVDDPYFKINRKLQSGQRVVVHVINPPPWMVNDWSSFKCQVNECEFDKDNVTERTDVVFVHSVTISEDMLPMRRWPGQLYIMSGRESPLHYEGVVLNANSSWRYAFNLTSTYRIDSDIMFPYGAITYKPDHNQTDFDRSANEKTKLVAWMVSNCGAPSRRNDYVREMKKYIPIDIYGRCGQYPSNCPGPDRGPCMEDILKHYKFYLAFENSICPDYVTEKFFKVFRRTLNVVPVVRGGADYDRLFPAGTFINAAWFRTAKDLALYLKNMSNETYLRYLKQVRQFREAATPYVLCRVCNAVLLQRSTPKIYDIKTWLEQPCPVPNFT